MNRVATFDVVNPSTSSASGGALEVDGRRIRFAALCEGSGIRVPLSEAAARGMEVPCPRCGRLLGVQARFGAAVMRALGSPAATTIPRHNRRKDGALP
jgi:hypothetical protein